MLREPRMVMRGVVAMVGLSGVGRQPRVGSEGEVKGVLFLLGCGVEDRQPDSRGRRRE